MSKNDASMTSFSTIPEKTPEKLPNGESNQAFEDDDSVCKSDEKQQIETAIQELKEQITDDDHEDLYFDESKVNPVVKILISPVKMLEELFNRYKRFIPIIVVVIIFLGVTAYMVVALIWNFNRALTLMVIWLVVVAYNIYAFIRDYFGNDLMPYLKPVYKTVNKNMFWLQWVFVACVVGGLATWIAIDTSKRPEQLISGAGYLVFLFILFLTSKHPERVRWRPVFWGLLIQVCLGMFILRTQAGFDAFNWLGNIFQTFINYADEGARFLYGDDFADHYFAMKVLSIVIYFGAFISVMYYIGAMQWLIFKIAFLMQITLGTSATESMVAAGNIFVSMTESPLLIRPYINDLTTSELHAVMTAGFGTIAGSVLGAYLGFGIKAVYVIMACFMAAPCALAVSKLVYPETKKSKFLSYEGLVVESDGYRNIVEAASAGASQAIPVVLNVGANLIAFISLLAAVNGFLNWFGGLLNCPELSFQMICSYVFMPITFLMGISWTDCFKCAELIGSKIFLNEFYAYEALSDMLQIRDTGTVPHVDPVTGVVYWVDERSEAIVTYALCGFANVSSVGIILGGLGIMAPHRRGEMAKIVIRALIAGIFVSLLNACVAGFLYVPGDIFCDNMLATTNWTRTDPDRLWQCCSTVVFPISPDTEACHNCCAYDWASTLYQINCTNVCM
nr:sodium/nucleoside cotransporter 1-like isoform X1 [Ciona intestinalis]|eukprot:XP_009860473.1 sodium/nucleoside cotransporter 1-like isoform X1 [Ciona intestinalis]